MYYSSISSYFIPAVIFFNIAAFIIMTFLAITLVKFFIKHSFLPLILIVFFTPLSIFFWVYFKPIPKPIPILHITNSVSMGKPSRLIIPAINVDAKIQPLGISAKGEMEVPESTVDVGWFDLGSIPGNLGSAVIAGHFDGKSGEPAVFSDLNKLQIGDELYVMDEKGISTTFTVSDIQTYDPGYADEVYSANDKAHLNLITCDGTWDKNKRSFTKRLVVFTNATP